MAVVQISYSRLLEEITEKLGIETPQCEISVAAEGLFLGHIDLQIVRGNGFIETIRCWGVLSSDLLAAKDGAVRVAVQKIKVEFDLHIKDTNYDDYILYKNMYDQVTFQYADQLGRFNSLQQEYNLLKECYVTGIAEKTEFIAERVEMRHTIDEYRMIIDSLRAEQLSTPVGQSEVGSVS